MGTLFIVATPIGNLSDISKRVLDVLGKVDLIACEDTRQTVKLLNHFGLQKPLTSYHEFNEEKKAEELADKIAGGSDVALVSDAGMPAISDPGYRLVRLC
ncbi:MAG TPA: SAM-dependent methyltransferase, partial [Terriglobia bacterium]|nr:SAM-dependent methyltransferase [Terriglobia bacterium]